MSEPREEYRVSWEMQPSPWSKPRRTERIYQDRSEAESHLDGLRSMVADHPPRQCEKHVWGIRFEVRTAGEWGRDRLRRCRRGRKG
jgi:hypothetical protein